MPAAAKMKAMKFGSFSLPFLRLLATRYKQAEKKDTDTMTMKFLLHKDKEEK